MLIACPYNVHKVNRELSAAYLLIIICLLYDAYSDKWAGFEIAFLWFERRGQCSEICFSWFASELKRAIIVLACLKFQVWIKLLNEKCVDSSFLKLYCILTKLPAINDILFFPNTKLHQDAIISWGIKTNSTKKETSEMWTSSPQNPHGGWNII